MEEEGGTTSCGLGSWRPSWLQSLASRQAYTAIYSLLGIVQGMGFSYLSAVLSTIEKQFGIRSKETAWVFSGNEISQICFIFALPFLSKIHRRTLWTSVAMILTAFGLFLCASPFFAKDKTVYDDGWNISGQEKLCTGGGKLPSKECNGIRDFFGMAIIFLGFFITGIGTSFFYSFGIPYIDDNVPKNTSPAVLGLVLGTRTLGPGLGYVLGSASLKLYVAPGRAPGLAEGDDGWLGAWWLGFVVVGGLTAVIAPILALFPQRLPGEEETEARKLEKENLQEPETAGEFVRHTLACAVRLASNKIYVFNVLSAVTALIGFVGFGTFIPKYFEFHFRQEASSSGFASLGSSVATGLGVVISGQVIARYRFAPKTLAGWSVLIGTVATLGLAAITMVSCPRLEVTSTKELACSRSCSCSLAEFQPTCSQDGVTLFFSPCHAGCLASAKELVDEEEKTVYSDCSCAREVSRTGNTTLSPLWARKLGLTSPVGPSSSSLVPVTGAVEGYCPSNSCESMFYLTLFIFATLSLLGSTGRVGGTIISLRAVEPRDKAASLVILVSLLSLFAFFPSPIIYGAMLDSACLIWGEQCQETTNCLLYDTDRMRYFMCGTTAACLAVSTLFDVGVWWNADQLKIWDEDDAEGKEKEGRGRENVKGGGEGISEESKL